MELSSCFADGLIKQTAPENPRVWKGFKWKGKGVRSG